MPQIKICSLCGYTFEEGDEIAVHAEVHLGQPMKVLAFCANCITLTES